MAYEIFSSATGTASLKHVESGQTMHSHVGSWEEANQVYIEQSGLDKLLSMPISSPLCIYDVGMGIAANAIAALECHARTTRKMEIHSFENDLMGIHSAMKQLDHFPFLKSHSDTVSTLLQFGEWKSDTAEVTWRIHPGNFFDQLRNAPSPDLIFYDFYSPRTCPELWGLEAFAKVRSVSRDDTLLCTYSVSTAVRCALLLSGFYVGHGRQTNAKLETTVASTKLSALTHPLSEKWLDHLNRSGSPIPLGSESALRRSDVLKTVAGLEQFRGL